MADTFLQDESDLLLRRDVYDRLAFWICSERVISARFSEADVTVSACLLAPGEAITSALDDLARGWYVAAVSEAWNSLMRRHGQRALLPGEENYGDGNCQWPT